MAHQAFRQVVKKVVSASSAVIATSADDAKDDMDEIAHLVFGAALPQGNNTPTTTTAPTGAITPTKHHSICEGPVVPITCTTPPAGHPIQVHSNPNTNAAIVSLGRRMAGNSAIQRGVMETISQSGWLMYGSGGMFIPLEDDDPGWAAPGPAQAEISDEDQPGIPLSDDEDWEEDFGDHAGVVYEEEALARSFPHMSIVGPAPRPLPNSNSVPLLSSMASASATAATSASHDHDESPQFSPTITPTPSRTSSIACGTTSSIDSEVKVHTQPSPPTTPVPSRTSTRTPSLEERRRARANAKRKTPGIIPSFVSWIRSFFVDVPPCSSTSTASTATEEKHPNDEKEGAVAVVRSVSDDAVVEGVPTALALSSNSSSTSTSSTAPPKSWWSRATQSTMITAAIGVATVILVLLVTKRVNPSVFTKVVAYLRR